MSKTLAEILGWEEGAVYKVGELYYSIKGVNLYYFKDFESSFVKKDQNIITYLLELVNEAWRVEPKKYYLKHKFLNDEGFNYLNYDFPMDLFYLSGNVDAPQTQFTDRKIKKIEATGFDLCNFEKVEVEDE